jgi:PAS domain-containing protein
MMEVAKSFQLDACELSLLEGQLALGLWSYNFSEGRLRWSAGMYKLLGLEPASVEPSLNLFFAALPPDERPLAERAWNTLHEQHAQRLEFSIFQPSGAFRRVLCLTSVIFDDWKPMRAIGAVVDITEQHDLRAAAATGDRRYAELMQSVGALLWTVAGTGHVISCPSWCALTGQNPEESRGQGWLNRVHEEQREDLWREWENAIRLGRAFEKDLLIRRRDDRWALYGLGCTPIMHPRSGTMINHIAVVIDLQPREWMLFEAMQSHRKFMSREPLVTGPLIRAARALLDWPAKKLAHKSRVSLSTIRRMESEGVCVHKDQTAELIQMALEEAGVEFLPFPDGSTGLRLR